MSVRVMTAVWAIDLPDSEKIVLLALADCANDEGLCWPGMASLRRKCSKGERTIQGAIKALCDKGHLTRSETPGKGCKYVVHPRSDCAPAATAPRKECAPQRLRDTPAATAGKPSKNHHSDAKASSSRGRFPKPEGVDEQVWRDFLGNRRRKKLTNSPTAHKRMMDDLERLADEQWTIPRLIEHAAAKGWGGIYDPRSEQARSTGPPRPFYETVIERRSTA